MDISSSLSFVTVVSGFVPIIFYDYRPPELVLPDLQCRRADVTHLPFVDDSISSLSCMHVCEHIGLERYGDTFDPQGDLKAMGELSRVLKKDGQLLFVVPVSGEARIAYNAHRIYRYADILKEFSGLDLQGFALVTDNRQFIVNATKAEADSQVWGCGCFHFKKSA